MMNVPVKINFAQWRKFLFKRIIVSVAIALVVIDVAVGAKSFHDKWVYINDAQIHALALEQCWEERTDAFCFPVMAESIQFSDIGSLVQMALITNAMLESKATRLSHGLHQRIVNWVQINNALSLSPDISPEEFQEKLKALFYDKLNNFLGKEFK